MTRGTRHCKDFRQLAAKAVYESTDLVAAPAVASRPLQAEGGSGRARNENEVHRVNLEELLPERAGGLFKLHEEEDERGGEGGEGQVEVEEPAPLAGRGETTANRWANGRCKSPDTACNVSVV